MSETEAPKTEEKTPAAEVVGEIPWQEIAAPSSNQIQRIGFSGMELAGQGPATAALVARQRANIESRFIMAMHRPRKMEAVRANIMNECRRPGFAEEAVYHVPRAGKQIEGLSIRFAEVAVRCMTNIPVDVVTIFENDEERIVEVTVTDLETNVTWSKQITVKKTVERKELKRGQRALRERTNSYGDRIFIVEASDDEVTTKESAMVSKSARTQILRLIPGNIKDEAFKLCKQISADKTAKDPDAQRNRMVDAFAELGIGIDVAALEEYFETPISKLSTKQISEMAPIYHAIRDNEITWKEALANRVKAPKNGTSTSTSTSTNGATSEKPAAPAAPATAQASQAPADTTKQTGEPAKGGRGAAAVKGKIAAEKAAANETPEQRLARLANERPTTTAAPTHGHDPHPNAAKSDPKTNAEPAPDIKPAPERAAPPPLTLVSPSASDIAASEARARATDDVIERPCAMCGVPIEARASDPPGGMCEACQNS